MTTRQTPPARRHDRPAVTGILLGLLLSCVAIPAVLAAESPRKHFELPADIAERSLKRFSLQSGIELVFATHTTEGVRTRALKGEFIPLDALNRLLAGTPLLARPDDRTGAIVVSRQNASGQAARNTTPPAAGDGAHDSVKKNETKTPKNQAPMKRNRLIDRIAATAALIISPISTAQVAPPPATPPAQEEAVELSPFVVTADSDEGYAARETLAGTRFKSDLKDTSVQVSIMTKEFLQDIASVTIEDAYRYSANIENLTEFTQTNGESSMHDPRLGTRIRGLTAPGLTHDFFRTVVKQDAYNIERLSISSGPNAILFGNGNPGGIVDIAFARPNLQRPKYAVSFRNDNYNSFRAALDLNQPLIKDRVGVRFAALNSRQQHWRKPAGRDDDRYYGAVSLKPFKSTTIRAYYEDAVLDEVNARNTRMGDQVTPWIKAGRPAFNNGLNSPDVINPSNRNIFTRNTDRNNLLVMGAADSVPYRAWGSAAGANIATASTAYSVTTLGPGSAPNQVGRDSYVYSLPYDESISPFDISVNGNGWRLLTYGKIWGLSIEQQLPGGLFFQADFNRERAKDVVANFLPNAAIRADANLFLPDRVTPNPNFGRYYVEAGGQQYSFRHEIREARAMLSHELDLTGRANWQKWLGRHRTAAMYLRSEFMNAWQSFHPRVVPPSLTSPAATLDNYNNSGFGASQIRQFRYRFYLSDPANPGTGGTYHMTLPFDPARGTTWSLPDANTFVAGYKNPYGATTPTALTNYLVASKVLAMQSFFLKNRLITNFGWRRDDVRQASYTTQPKTTATSAFESMFELDPPTNWSFYTSGDTTTMGAVAHVLPWFSVFYNQSATWSPPTGYINPNDGTQVEASIGDGKDYGFMLRFLDNRVSLRLNKYENTAGPNASVAFRNPILGAVRNIELTLLERAEEGLIAPPPATPHYDPNTPLFVNTTLSSDQISRGYEAELIVNPTRNWRVALNGSHSSATQSNIGKPWIEFIRERSPVWSANADLTGPDSATNTIGNRYLGIVQTLNLMAQSDGQKVEQGRAWRVNLVTRYGFSEGVLRGAFVGGGYRWRSQQVLGYRSILVDNGFQFAGAPAQLEVPALKNPIFGEPLEEVEVFLGYQRRLGKKVTWRVQLNIRNLFDDRDPLAQRANMGEGFVTVYDVPAPRSFILSNTFTF